MNCSKQLLLYLATIYGSYRDNVVLQEKTIFMYKSKAKMFNLTGKNFHFNLGLRQLDHLGITNTYSCITRRSSPMQEVLRVGTKYYVRGRGREIKEGGDVGCWFLKHAGSGIFLNVSGMMNTSRKEVWTQHKELFNNLTLREVSSDLMWCRVASKLNVQGFIFGHEIVKCNCGPKFSTSCVQGLKKGWSGSKDCNCNASKEYLSCA